MCDRRDARAAAASHTFPRDLAQRAMVLVSERDKVVPLAMGREIFGALRASGGYQEGWKSVGGSMRIQEPPGRFVVVVGALHEDAWRYREWTRAMAIMKYSEDIY